MKMKCYKTKTLFRGYVTHENGSPVAGAVVIIEPIIEQCRDYERLIQSTTTNCHGEFYFIIKDIGMYYRVKIFDNDNFKNC